MEITGLCKQSFVWWKRKWYWGTEEVRKNYLVQKQCGIYTKRKTTGLGREREHEENCLESSRELSWKVLRWTSVRAVRGIRALRLLLLENLFPTHAHTWEYYETAGQTQHKSPSMEALSGFWETGSHESLATLPVACTRPRGERKWPHIAFKAWLSLLFGDLPLAPQEGQNHPKGYYPRRITGPQDINILEVCETFSPFHFDFLCYYKYLCNRI